MSTTTEGVFTVEGTELYTKTWTVGSHILLSPREAASNAHAHSRVVRRKPAWS